MQTETIHSPVSLVVRGLSIDCRELNRLMAAAVVNEKFCRLLLEDPGLALDSGYQGESFLFTSEERSLILSIRADSLAELASQLVRTFNENLDLPVNQPVQPAELLGF
ncbi:MAG TPA: hypothetical protein VMC09_18820 [Anaerolineales bacterium]|nr:hypothetical protein [Anaerolineales bacterium]